MGGHFAGENKRRDPCFRKGEYQFTNRIEVWYEFQTFAFAGTNPAHSIPHIDRGRFSRERNP